MKVKKTMTRTSGSHGTLFSMNTPDEECIHDHDSTGVVDAVITIDDSWEEMLPLHYSDSKGLHDIMDGRFF
jgi:hypothetical protein